MELTTLALPKLTANADYIFVEALNSLPREAYNSGIFKIIPVGMHTGDTRVFTEMDDEEYASFRGEGDDAERSVAQVGYDITVTAEYMAKDIGITEKMRSFNKYPEVVRKFTNLGKLVPNKMDLDLTHRLTFGAATTYTDAIGRTIAITTGDTKALFATDHALQGSTTTYRSIVANNPLQLVGRIFVISFTRSRVSACWLMSVPNSVLPMMSNVSRVISSTMSTARCSLAIGSQSSAIDWAN